MAQRKTSETPGSDIAANSGETADTAQAGTELPAVASPSISPAKTEASADLFAEQEPVTPAPAVETQTVSAVETPAAKTALKFPSFHLRPRHKRHALLAASVAIAAAFGTVVGAAMTGGFAKTPTVDMATVQQNKATQQSVAHLTNEIANLKASLEAANKAAHSQIAKLSDRLRETADITGTVAPPQTVPPAPQAGAPLPAPRPPQAAEAPPPRLSIVPDWTIRETRDGYVYVQGHGDIYQVVPGAPLPGLGPVAQIKRQDGRWLVVTPKGIIVSMRDRHYFEQF